jgi:hypothetical protein
MPSHLICAVAKRMRCAILIPGGVTKHEGDHTHSLGSQPFHYCETRFVLEPCECFIVELAFADAMVVDTSVHCLWVILCVFIRQTDLTDIRGSSYSARTRNAAWFYDLNTLGDG